MSCLPNCPSDRYICLLVEKKNVEIKVVNVKKIKHNECSVDTFSLYSDKKFYFLQIKECASNASN